MTLFGAPFDTYSEAEAIAEGYIVDVAASIISYKTLYHLHCPVVPTKEEEKVYPKGAVAKTLQNVAYQDDGLIQYKAEVMLRIFEKDVKPLIGGRAKAMIIAASRVAGLRYFNILKEKIKERGAGYKVLYAFSDFVHPETNEAISEHAANDLKDGELIEDRFKGEEYRLMVVASKFQAGFNQPLLAGKLAQVIDQKGLSVQAEDLSEFNGAGDAKAAALLAAIEFARRRIKPEGAKIQTPADLLPHIQHYADRKQEHFLCASINGANEILNIRVVSIGLVDRTPVHPREVFADALADRASAVIVAHSHPLVLSCIES